MIDCSISAFLLAAGKGTRLQPITTELPKPIIPLPHGDTLLGTIIERLQNSGIKNFAVNGHYLAEVLHDYLKLRVPNAFTFYYEKELLGTGGPLIAAKEQLMTSDYFILHNGDILLDIDFEMLIEKHIKEKNIFTVVALDGPENRLLVDSENKILDILGKLGVKMEASRLLTYCGVAIFSKAFFKYLPNEIQNYSLIDGFINALKANESCGVYQIDTKSYWNDLGTVEKYLQTALDFPTVFKSPKCPTACFEKIAEQGSARSFYRMGVSLYSGTKSYVLMKSFEGDADFERYVEYGKILYDKTGITPKIYGVNQDNLSVLNEDLGRCTLYDFVKENHCDVALQEHIYGKVVKTLYHYQQEAKILPALVRQFDYDYLRWETAYFKEHLLGTHLKMNFSNEVLEQLEYEFDHLAKTVDSQYKVFIHRDFQSQNIMIQEGKIRFVDFQGGRMGSGLYDLVSLAFDPYLQLPNSVIDIIFSTYEELSGKTKSQSYVVALQRLMQALGAYGYLSHIKGKSRYLAFIAPALEKLSSQLEKVQIYPMINKVVLEAIELQKQKGF